MTLSLQIAKHLRDVYFGGNWTCSNYKDTLAGLSWQQATAQVYSFNSIATLVQHTVYYVRVQCQVLQGNALDAKDELSFAHPPIKSQEGWNLFLDKVWKDVETAAALIEQLPDTILNKNFTDAKYGTYYRNLAGMIEHLHYHLGQIALIKKIILQENPA